MEGHRSGIIRRQVGICPQGDRGNDIGIHPVLHIGGLNLTLGRGFIKPDDADAQCIDDVGIVLRPGGVAGPGGNAKVAELQKHGTAAGSYGSARSWSGAGCRRTSDRKGRPRWPSYSNIGRCGSIRISIRSAAYILQRSSAHSPHPQPGRPSCRHIPSRSTA